MQENCFANLFLQRRFLTGSVLWNFRPLFFTWFGHICASEKQVKIFSNLDPMSISIKSSKINSDSTVWIRNRIRKHWTCLSDGFELRIMKQLSLKNSFYSIFKTKTYEVPANYILLFGRIGWIQPFLSNWPRQIASAARSWIKSASQTDVTNFALTSV